MAYEFDPASNSDGEYDAEGIVKFELGVESDIMIDLDVCYFMFNILGNELIQEETSDCVWHFDESDIAYLQEKLIFTYSRDKDQLSETGYTEMSIDYCDEWNDEGVEDYTVMISFNATLGREVPAAQ